MRSSAAATHLCVCGAMVLSRAHSCVECARRANRARSHRLNEIYRDPIYRAQPSEGICHICGKPTNGFGTRDHIVTIDRALQLGWTKAQINDPSNIAPAHSWCNFMKGANSGANQKGRR